MFYVIWSVCQISQVCCGLDLLCSPHQFNFPDFLNLAGHQGSCPVRTTFIAISQLASHWAWPVGALRGSQEIRRGRMRLGYLFPPQSPSGLCPSTESHSWDCLWAATLSIPCNGAALFLSCLQCLSSGAQKDRGTLN